MLYLFGSKLNELEAGELFSGYFDLMNKAKKIYARWMEPICKQRGLTQNELDVLLFLYNNPSLNRAADIVACRGIAKSHVSLSVANLERRKLLLRCFEPTDRRTAHLKLTEQGNTIAQEGHDIQLRFFSQVNKGVTEAEFDVWRKVTQKVCENVKNLDETLINP